MSKHLLEAIDRHRRPLTSSSNGADNTAANGKLSLSKAVELKALIQEIRESTDEKNSFTEFYDTLERIVNELRGMTEHSAAFLARVRKADAPNYFEVIKRPMDLGTVLKKVKQHGYKDKKSFAEDLHLIWDNCFEYNSWTEHPLRKSATIMRNKTNSLLQFVTDVPIKPQIATGSVRSGSVLAASEADAEGESDDEADETNLTRKGRASRKRPGEKKPKTENVEDGDGSFDFGDLGGDTADGTPERALAPSRDRTRSPSLLDASNLRKSSLLALSQSQSRRKLTARTDLLPFEERPALQRTSDGMNIWLEKEQAYPMASTSAVTLDDEAEPTKSPATLQTNMEVDTNDLPTTAPPTVRAKPTWKPMPLPVQQLSGRQMPAFAAPLLSREASSSSLSQEQPLEKTGKPKDLAWWEEAIADDVFRNALPVLPYRVCDEADPTTEKIETPRHPQMESLIGRMRRNRTHLTQLKSAQQRINDLQAKASNDTEEPDVSTEGQTSTLLLALPPDATVTGVHQLCLEMSMHAGFDAVLSTPLQILSDVTLRFVNNLARSLQYIAETATSASTGLHNMQRVLALNGLSTDDLHQYATTEVDTYGQQLRDTLEKMVNVERKLLERPSAADMDDSDDAMDEELSDSQKPPNFVSLMQESEQETKLAVEAQIGLLQPFFVARSKTAYGLKDDTECEIPAKLQRQKVDPSGRIPVPNKRKIAALNNANKKQKM